MPLLSNQVLQYLTCLFGDVILQYFESLWTWCGTYAKITQQNTNHRQTHYLQKTGWKGSKLVKIKARSDPIHKSCPRMQKASMSRQMLDDNPSAQHHVFLFWLPYRIPTGYRNHERLMRWEGTQQPCRRTSALNVLLLPSFQTFVSHHKYRFV